MSLKDNGDNMKHEKDDTRLPPLDPEMSSVYRRSVFIGEASIAKTRPLVEASQESSTKIQQKRNERRLLARIASLEERVGILEAFIRSLPRNGRF
jgi:hypothetical protein